MYEKLLEPMDLGPTLIRNRVFNPPHGTSLGHAGVITDELIAYHQTRARGGVGLIILEGMTFHPSYGFKEAFLYAGSDDIIPGMKKLGDACRKFDTAVFGQLFHAGRAVRLSHDGSKPLTYSASDIADERYRVIPVPMPNEMVWEIIESYVDAAGRLVEAGLDGVEILAGMGYLIAQFLNTEIDPEALEQIRPDVIINATGASARFPDVDLEDIQLVDSWTAIRGEAALGQRVVIADWACDWTGLGLAQQLAQDGHHVRLVCGAATPGESLQGIVRDQWIGELHKLEVEITPFARFYGACEGTAFFQHMTSNQPILCEDVDSIISCYAPRSNRLEQLPQGVKGQVETIGDAISPRTVEEAILEGYKAAINI